MIKPNKVEKAGLKLGVEMGLSIFFRKTWKQLTGEA
jgi:hypothetical protein